MRIFACLLSALLFSTHALAADWTGSLRTATGQPIKDAVVAVYPASGATSPPHADGPLLMMQRNMQFEPFVLLVPLNADVAFPNRDAVRHHVYSFSPAKTFELKLYGRDETRKVHFDKPGTVALGCNIHDSMVAFIRVVDTGFAAKSEAGGDVVVRGLPPGPATVRIWHPCAPNNELTRHVVIPVGGLHDAVVLSLRAPPTQRRGAY